MSSYCDECGLEQKWCKQCEKYHHIEDFEAQHDVVQEITLSLREYRRAVRTGEITKLEKMFDKFVLT